MPSEVMRMGSTVDTLPFTEIRLEAVLEEIVSITSSFPYTKITKKEDI
jgi:hypothetical protein